MHTHLSYKDPKWAVSALVRGREWAWGGCFARLGTGEVVAGSRDLKGGDSLWAELAQLR